MGPPQTENAAPAPAPPVATVHAPAGQRPAGGRGLIVVGTALIACAAVVAGIVITNNSNNGAGVQTANGGSTDAAKLPPSDPAAGKPDAAPPLPPEVVEREVQQILKKVEHLDQTVW